MINWWFGFPRIPFKMKGIGIRIGVSQTITGPQTTNHRPKGRNKNAPNSASMLEILLLDWNYFCIPKTFLASHVSDFIGDSYSHI